MARNCHNSDWYVYSRFGGCQVGATCLEAVTIYHKNVYFEVSSTLVSNHGNSYSNRNQVVTHIVTMATHIVTVIK